MTARAPRPRPGRGYRQYRPSVAWLRGQQQQGLTIVFECGGPSFQSYGVVGVGCDIHVPLSQAVVRRV
jgi:hypothetical protein